MRNPLAPFVLCCLALAGSPALAWDSPAVQHLVQVSPPASDGVTGLHDPCLDVVEARPDGSLVIVAGAEELRRLSDGGFDCTILISDLSSYYEKRLLADPGRGSRAWPNGSMSGYYTNAEVEAELDSWAILYPHLITPKFSVGKTVEGRDIWAVKISDNPGTDEPEPEVFYDSMTHPREVMGMMTVLWYMKNLLEQYGVDPELTYLVDNREIWFVPVHNPDGHVYNEQTNPNGGGMWRKNRRNNGGGTWGVDLARNYSFMWGYNNTGSSPNPGSIAYRGPYAFSEPEAVAVSGFIKSRPIVTSWNTHTFTNVYICPFCYDDVLPYGTDWPLYKEYLEDISAENGYPVGPSAETLHYYANGTPLDWHYAEAGTFALAPEIGTFDDGFWPPYSRIMPLVEENYFAIRYWSWIAGSFVVLAEHFLNDDDGDGLILPGEPIDLVVTLRNKGLADTTVPVKATLSSANPNVAIIHGTHDFGIVPSAKNAHNVGRPLRIKLKNTIPYGEEIVLRLDIDFDGHTRTEEIRIVCGVPEVLYAADMESDPGWTVGDTGDNALTGIWVRSDPIGIMDRTQHIQPEDDRTADPGALCFVTGNGSYVPDGDDVDHGKTTLKTALFDIDGIVNATVSYWRWYADLGPVHNNDILQVDISNDGGSTWVNVESLEHTVNEWQEVLFRVGDLVTPTGRMMMRFVARDEPDDSYCEACVDEFAVTTYDPPVSLALSGPPRIGTSVNVLVDSPDDGGLEYLLLASFDTYPAIPVQNGTRFVPLAFDWLTQMSMNPGNGIFVNFYGYLDGAGQSAKPKINIPGAPGLVGKTVFVAGVTLNPTGSRVRNISAPLAVTLE